MTYYEAYYSDQIGGGGRGVHNVFVGSTAQRGHGVGSWLAGLFRRAIPFLTKGVRAVGKEALKTGVNILDDISENRATFKESLHNRLNESGRNLKRKAVEKIHDIMEGSGYKTHALKKTVQYPWSNSAVHIRSTTPRRKSRKRSKTGKKKLAVKRLKRKTKKKVHKKNHQRKKTVRKSKQKKQKRFKQIRDIFH